MRPLNVNPRYRLPAAICRERRKTHYRQIICGKRSKNHLIEFTRPTQLAFVNARYCLSNCVVNGEYLLRHQSMSRKQNLDSAMIVDSLP